MAPIRVLNIITRLERGGAPQALLETIQRISPEFQIDLATGQTDDKNLDLAQTITQTGLTLIHVPTLRRAPHPLRDIKALCHLIKIIKKGRYQLIHTHTSKAGFLGRLAARYCNISAVIHSPHGTILEGYFSPFVTQFYTYLERLTAPLTRRIVCLTSREIDQYLHAKIGKRDQYTYIYNGIDIDAFARNRQSREDVRQMLGIPNDAMLCATVGRLVPVKGHKDLIAAIPDIIAHHPNTHLIIIGEGELRSELAAQIYALCLNHNIHLLGWRSNIPDLLGASDIFVLPSLNEGLGLVLIEAMAQKLPIIATRVGGIPEVVSDGATGLIVPPQSPAHLSQKINQLIDNKDQRIAIGHAGYQRACTYFSIEATVSQTEKLYRQFTGSPA